MTAVVPAARAGASERTRSLIDFLAERFALLDDPFRGPG
jgi:hypothetical protein